MRADRRSGWPYYSAQKQNVDMKGRISVCMCVFDRERKEKTGFRKPLCND